MNSSYLNSVRNIVLLSKPSKTIGLLLMVLFVFMVSNVSNAQTASSTWALTANGNPTNVGNVSGTTIAFGSGLNSPAYSAGAGVTTGSWSNDAGSLQNDEYYEFEVTPNANTVFNVTAINFEHSRSNGNWQVRAYYSTDDFATSTPITNAFSSNNSSPTSNNNTVNIDVENTTLKVRIYGWESDGSNRSLRIRNFVISGTTCTKPSAAGTITGTTAVCQGANSITYSVPAITNATGYTWTLPAGATIASGANTRTITVNFSLSAISGNVTVQGTNSCGSGTVSSAFVVTVNPSPTVTTSASPTSVASGGNVTLTASVTTPTTQNTILLSEGFNGVTNTWTTINNSTGGTPANAAWTLRPDGYSYAYSGYPTRVFHSNDNSQFYLSNSAAQGNATTATILQSPAMSTVGYTSLSLEFYQYNLDFDGSDYARVEVSTNGSSWTTLSNTTTTQGAENNFLQTTVNLNSYINQNTLYIRFKYDAQFDWFWAIDNVTVSGNKTIPYTYSWSASPSGTAGLPSGAGTASTSNNSIVVNPTFSTAYTVTATNPISGCVGTSSVNVTVLVPAPTITSLGSTSGCVGSSITINGTNLSGTIAANVLIGGTAVTSITSISATQIVAVIGGGTTGNVTVTNSGGTATSGSVFTVNTAPLAPGTSTPNSPSCSGFTAQWAWTANATTYYLDVATDNGFTSIVPAYNNLNVGNVLSYALTGLNPATTYYYRVRASGCSTSVSSATMSLATSSVAIPGTASPHSPSCNGFTAQWAWTANATTYYLDVATDNGFTSIVPAYNNLNVGNVLNYVLIGLNPGTTYYYRVRASGCGTSTSSATMTYATTASPTTAPTASAATSSNCNDATLNWNSIANATAYYLDIATDSGFTTFVSGYNNLYIGYYPSSGYYAGSLPSGVVLFYRVRATNGCNVTTTSSNTVTFQTAAPLGGSVSSAQSIYSGTSPADLTLTGYSATNIIYWQKSTDAAFTSPTNITETTATLSGATIGNLFADTYFRAVVQNQFGSWCISNSNPVLITVVVVAAPLPPTTTVVHPSCAVSTGSITVTSPVPAADISYTVVGTNPVVAGVTNTTGVFSGLVAGDYNVIVNNTVTGLSTGKSETINAIVTNTWNGTVWSDGTPNNNQKIVFAANYSSTGNISACSCMVTSGAVTFNANDTLTLTNELKITAGSLTFENSASLVQINDAAINSGNIIYKRNTSSVRISDYTYWSSPVANQNLAISPAYTSGMFYSFNDFATPETWKSESASTIMTVGKGYIIRGQQIGSPTPPPPPSFYQATFTGTPHNGNKSIAIGPIGNSNLLGNPYPSAIDADKFLSANSTVIEGTIYFWTHNTAIQLASNITNGTAGSGAFAYTSDDYASYNGTGGVAVSGGIIPTGEIAAGQAFFTTSKATGGSVAFNNAMRLSSGGAILDNSQFFKIKNTKGKTAQIEKNRIWLNLTNAKGAFKQTLVGYIAGATNDIDNAFDGESFDGQEFIDFYSVNQGKNLTIQGRALPFSENDEVPLGFRSTIEGPFTISIDQVDGSMTNQKIFIEDKLTNTITDLSAGNYTFSTVAGTFNDRFVLRYTNGKTLGTDTVTTQENKVVVSIQNKQIKINSLSETINKVAIFDLLGRQIYQNNKVDSNEFLTTDFSSSHQALIVKTTLQNGELVTNKIIF